MKHILISISLFASFTAVAKSTFVEIDAKRYGIDVNEVLNYQGKGVTKNLCRYNSLRGTKIVIKRDDLPKSKCHDHLIGKRKK